jgi:hypothetical protein
LEKHLSRENKYLRELQILTTSKSFPYPKGEKNGHRRWPYMRVLLILYTFLENSTTRIAP